MKLVRLFHDKKRPLDKVWLSALSNGEIPIDYVTECQNNGLEVPCPALPPGWMPSFRYQG